MAIQKRDYNRAKAILSDAGSQTAAASHPVHGSGSVPDFYGTGLLAAARDEFRGIGPVQRAGMSNAHYDAVHAAAQQMGINHW